MPMDVAVADSQGSIGYMLERALRNVLLKRESKRDYNHGNTGYCR